jgi:hypothetical protein
MHTHLVSPGLEAFSALTEVRFHPFGGPFVVAKQFVIVALDGLLSATL